MIKDDVVTEALKLLVERGRVSLTDDGRYVLKKDWADEGARFLMQVIEKGIAVLQ
jgi:hypothetical protein